MRKNLFKLISLLVALTMGLAVLASCGIVEVDTDKDMNQVVATVSVEQFSSDIYKREIVSGYMSYGYYYVSNYSYTTDQALSLVLDNLIKNRIIVMKSKAELIKISADIISKKDSVTGLNEFEQKYYDRVLSKSGTAKALTDASSLEDFLSTYDVSKATCELNKSMSSLIDTYDSTINSDETATAEDESLTVRTVPTEASEAEADETEDTLTEESETAVADKIKEYNAYPIVPTVSTRKSAVKKSVEALVDNGLLDSDEYSKLAKLDDADAKYDIRNYSYYKTQYKSSLESLLVGKYEEYLKQEAETKLDENALWNEYEELAKQQKATYDNATTTYESELGSVSDTSFVTYNPLSGYAYVSNLLIPFTTEQSEILSANKPSKDNSVTVAEYKAFRNTLAQGILATDLRSTWVQSGYGEYDTETGAYTFDEKYLISDSTDGLLTKFTGELVNPYYTVDSTTEFKYNAEKGIWEDTTEDITTYKFEQILNTYMGFEAFMTAFENIMGATADTSASVLNSAYYNPESYSGSIDLSDFTATYSKFEDLMFAFSSDTGCLNTEYGYVYTPNNNSYVQEFFDACKDLVAQENPVGKYVVCLTDYGYHIILCTKIIDQGFIYDEASFKADLSTEGTVAYNFRQVKRDSNIDGIVTKMSNSILGDYNNDDHVTKYPKTYKNYFEESDSSK